MKFLNLCIGIIVLCGINNTNTMNIQDQDTQFYETFVTRAREAIAQNNLDLAELLYKRASHIANKYPGNPRIAYMQERLEKIRQLKEQRAYMQSQACPITGKRGYQEPMFLSAEENPLDVLTFEDYEIQGSKRTLLPEN